MKNNHIQTYSFWEIYRQLPQDEAKNFVSFVESAYHNSNRRLIPLAKEFHDVHKKKVPPHRESIWQKSFSARYNNQVFKITSVN